jgi:crossover junction endodeoxyribonuclease RuvC
MSNAICFMGVDPGISGAIAFYYPEHPDNVAVYDMPSIGKEVNCAELTALIRQYRPDYAVVESVHAMPKQGVSSSFNFGMSYGMARGVIAACGVPQQLVAPTKWKKFFALTADKDTSRRLAILTWPGSEHFNRKKDDGRAEAALLAVYGAKTQG